MLADECGFYFASASVMLEDELKAKDQPLERENKRRLSAEWRRQYGVGAVIDKALTVAGRADKIVVASLRHPGECDRVHELGGTVIWVDADPRIRYGRIISGNRGRVEDNKTYEQFIAEEEIEMSQSGDENTLNMGAVKAKADISIENDGNDINDFEISVRKLLQDSGLI